MNFKPSFIKNSMEEKMKKRSLLIGVCLAFCLLFASSASAALFKCRIYNVVPWANGEIKIQIVPVEGSFTDTPARVFIDTTKAGGKYVFATVLTAISLDAEITVSVSTTPTFATPQEVLYIGLVNPTEQ
jgi:hypothetical protein